MEKKTKVMYYAEIKELLQGVEGTEEMVEFIDAEVARIADRAEKNKARKALAKAEAQDELKDAVAAVLTEEFQGIDAIVAAIEVEDATKAKVVNRLSKLVADGVAVKDMTKIGDRKVVCYKLA